MSEVSSQTIVEPKHFEIPEVHVNSFGWGPCTVSDKFVSMPFQLFSKDEKLGRIIDFSIPSGHRKGDDSDASDDDSFINVETVRAKSNHKKILTSRRQQKNQQRNAAAAIAAANEEEAANQPGYVNQYKPKVQKYVYRKNNQNYTKLPSVEIKPTWKPVSQFIFSELNKKIQKEIPQGKDIVQLGILKQYKDSMSKVTPKAPIVLKHDNNAVFFSNITTTDDSVFETLAPTGIANVYATDQIISHLMIAAKTSTPWDIIVRKVNGVIFLDHRDGVYDLLTVDETASDAITDVDKENALKVEATVINQSFNEFVVDKVVEDKDIKPNPFFDEEEHPNGHPSSTVYKYRKFQLTEDLSLLVRTEVHGIEIKGEQKKYINSYALNEWDVTKKPNQKWRSMLDKASGQVLFNEIKNNNTKVCKWIAQSILAGVDAIKLGYVTRKGQDAKNHILLNVDNVTPSVFAANALLNEKNLWAVLINLLTEIKKQPDGKYYLVRDPSKPILRLYSVPDDESDDEEEDDDDDSSESSSDDDSSDDDDDDSSESSSSDDDDDDDEE
ncbi:hypothetical protein WA158_002308 [Blastocystis sp. Blastoise]